MWLYNRTNKRHFHYYKNYFNLNQLYKNLFIGAPEKLHVTHSGSVFIAQLVDSTGWTLASELTQPGAGLQTVWLV